MAGNSLKLLVNFSERGLDKLSGGLKNLVGLGKNGSQVFRDLRRDSSKLERELREVRAQLGAASGNVTELVDRERQLERAVEEANEALRRQGKLAQIDAGASAMRRRGGELKSRGTSNMIGGAAMLFPLAAAAKAGGDFSSTMVDIQQKANLSDTATRRMRNNIIDAARATAQMPDQMAASVEALAGLGLDPREAAKLAMPLGRFMTAYKVEGQDASSALYAGLSSLQIPLARAGKLMDMMAEGGNRGAFEVRDMAAAFPSLTSQMAAMGQVGEGAAAELIAALQIVRGKSGNSQKAATNMENLLAKLTAPATLKKFEKQGIDAFAAIEKGIANGISPLETMIALTKKATGGDSKKLGFLFEDMQAQTAMRALMQDYDQFAAMKQGIGAAGGLTDAAFGQRMANDQNAQMRQMAAAGSGLILAIAPVLTPALTALAQAITPIATSIAQWARENPGLAQTILMTVAGMGAARVGLGALQFAFGSVLGPMSTLFSLWRKYKLLGSVAAVFPKAAMAVRLLGGAFRFALGPVGLLIMAIGLVAVAVYKNWDTIKSFLTGAMAWMAGLPSRFLAFGSNIIGGLVHGITGAGSRIFSALKNVIGGAVDKVKNFLGIRSPSRLFMGFGGFMSQGMALGIDRDRDRAFASARRLATGVAGAAALSAPGFAAGASPSRPLAAPSAPAPVTIQIYQQPGQDADGVAAAVRRELERIERERRSATASAFGD